MRSARPAVPQGAPFDGGRFPFQEYRAQLKRMIGGQDRNRTGVRGFAGRCITTLPPGRIVNGAPWAGVIVAENPTHESASGPTRRPRAMRPRQSTRQGPGSIIVRTRHGHAVHRRSRPCRSPQVRSQGRRCSDQPDVSPAVSSRGLRIRLSTVRAGFSLAKGRPRAMLQFDDIICRKRGAPTPEVMRWAV